MPLIVMDLELPPLVDIKAFSVSTKVAWGLRLARAATPPDTNAVAEEVPAVGAQQSKLFPSEHRVGNAYWLLV